MKKYDEIVAEWRTMAAMVEADKAVLDTTAFADRSLALQAAIEALKETDPAAYGTMMAEIYAKVHPVERYAVAKEAREDDVAAVETIHERDERITAALTAAVKEYIENLPKEVVQHDESGRITSRHPLRFEGTEFPVGTNRGQFAVSIYPAPYSRNDARRDAGGDDQPRNR